MDEIDRRLIATLQGGLSSSVTPWADAADVVGIELDDLLSRLERMKDAGVLRGVRAILDQRRLGIDGNVLVAWRVAEDRVDAVGAQFAARREVSHCVLRTTAPAWPYNLYTMIHAATPEAARAVVEQMRAESAVDDHVSLETVRELKKTSPRYF